MSDTIEIETIREAMDKYAPQQAEYLKEQGLWKDIAEACERDDKVFEETKLGEDFEDLVRKTAALLDLLEPEDNGETETALWAAVAETMIVWYYG